jgi:hypothetical protein
VVERYPNANPLKNHALMQEVHKDVTAEREETQLVRTLKNKSKINKKISIYLSTFYINIYFNQSLQNSLHILRASMFSVGTLNN